MGNRAPHLGTNLISYSLKRHIHPGSTSEQLTTRYAHSRRMNFKESTQRQRWLFTADRLAEIRQQNRDRSAELLSKALQESATANRDSETSEGAGPRLELISVEEELLLLKHYQATIQHICQELRFPRKVLGTALHYLKRFYLCHSTLDHDPQYIVVACLYLACKIEDCYISAAELGRLTGLPQDLLLRNELPLLEALKFDFIIFSPYRAIDGLVEDIAACRRSMAGSSSGRTFNGFNTDPGSVDEGLLSLSEEQTGAARAAALQAADALMLTDAPLLYTPGQLALAACRSGFSKVGVRLHKFVDRVAQEAAAGSGSSEEGVQQQRRQLQQVLAALDVLGAEGAKKPVKEEVQAIDGRLKACRGPLLDSDAVKKAAAAKAQTRADKQQRKAERLRQQKAAEEAALGLAPILPQPAAAQQPLGETGQQPPAKRARPSEPL